jgi:hypothetical protein
VGNAIYMEPIDGVEVVPKSRWKLVRATCERTRHRNQLINPRTAQSAARKPELAYSATTSLVSPHSTSLAPEKLDI